MVKDAATDATVAPSSALAPAAPPGVGCGLPSLPDADILAAEDAALELEVLPVEVLGAEEAAAVTAAAPPRPEPRLLSIT